MKTIIKELQEKNITAEDLMVLYIYKLNSEGDPDYLSEDGETFFGFTKHELEAKLEDMGQAGTTFEEYHQLCKSFVAEHKENEKRNEVINHETI